MDRDKAKLRLLQHTFCHIPRITPTTETMLWMAGLDSWQAVRNTAELPMARVNRDLVCRELELSERNLIEGNARFFADRLPPALVWRLFPEYRQQVAYLDIETTGLAGGIDRVTTIALYDGREIRYYVQGQNLERFAEDVRQYGVLVTYNGKCFDLPFLRASLNLRFEQAHIDLRYVLRRLGFRGGLKGCEKQLGISRDELDGVDGYMAVLLWREYEATGNPRALETLLSYNIQDVLNLETLLVLAYNLEIQATPFAALRALPLPVLPPNPLVPDVPLIRRLQASLGWPRWAAPTLQPVRGS